MHWTGLCPQVILLCKSRIKHNRLHSSCQHMQWLGEKRYYCTFIVCFTLRYGVAVWCGPDAFPGVFLRRLRRGRPEAGCGGDVFVCCRAAAVQWVRTAKGAAAEWPQELLWQLDLPECSQEVQSLSGHFDQCCDANCPSKVLWDTCALSPFMYSGKCLFLRLIRVPLFPDGNSQVISPAPQALLILWADLSTLCATSAPFFSMCITQQLKQIDSFSLLKTADKHSIAYKKSCCLFHACCVIFRCRLHTWR